MKMIGEEVFSFLYGQKFQDLPWLVGLTGRVKFAEWDGSVNGAVWPKTMILKGVDDFFHFYSFTIRKRSLCRCISMEVSPLNKKQIFHFYCIFTTVSISLFHEIRNGA